MKKLVFTSIAVAAFAAFAEFTPTAEDAEAFAAGQPVTNAQKTAEFRKFGKIKAKDAVVTDVTKNVIKRGENVWTDDDYDENPPPDGIWGYIIKRVNEHSDVTSYHMYYHGGTEFWSTNTSTDVKFDPFTYTGYLRDKNVTNVPFQEGTNKNGRVVYNTDGSYRLTSPMITLPVSNQCYVTEKGLDIFASRKWVRNLMISLGHSAAEVDAAISAMAD